MKRLLVSTPFDREFGAELEAFCAARGLAIERVLLPEDPQARVPREQADLLDYALFTTDIHPQGSRSFYSALRSAPRLSWLHVFNAGVDAPIFTELMQRGVRLTTSSGANAEAVAHSALAGLLALSRGLPRWMAQQRERIWAKTPRESLPPDLRGQRLLLLGAGAIAGHIGRVAQALGLRVAVVRASARASATRADAPRAPRVDVCCGFDEAEFPPEPQAAVGAAGAHDPARPHTHVHVHGHAPRAAPDAGAGSLAPPPHVEAAALLPDWADEVHPPGVLGALLPVTDWLVIACPLTEDTRGWIDAAAIARLPRRACVINVGRGEIVDPAALTDALAAGRLAGAYLDVFDPEPLPADSALWGVPNVILSPHDAASAAGNDRRVFERFCDNLDRLQAGRALVNEARP
jgi:phosphoglycerate dehydrogenase-like enzyme